MSPVIELDRLSKSFGGRRALDEVSLEVSGGIFALLGPNGAGKTTLVSILTTVMRADCGSARILGFDVGREAARVRRYIGVTGQYAAIDEALTGRENLIMIGRLYGLGRVDARRRADELLESFDLEDAAGRTVSGYSGGMRRRVDLAATLVLTPAILFLDEPTTGLDPASRAQVWDGIGGRAAEGCCVFMTTQMLDEAEALADRVAILQDGRIVADGTVERLIAQVGAETAVLVDDAGQVRRSLGAPGDAGELARVLDGLGEEDRGLHLELRRPTLDDAFFALTGRSGRAGLASGARDTEEAAA